MKLDKKFDSLFTKKTSSPTLNKQLSKTYAKKEKLLRVLERPETPLHNNSTETDARDLWLNGKSLCEHGAIRERDVETLL